MSAESETIADIVNAMRDEYARRGGSFHGGDAIDWLRYADRIEAAAKRMEVMHNRETEHYKQERNEAPAKERKRLQDNGFLIIRKEDAVGNAAAMREALEKAKKAICHHAAHVCCSLSWENSDIQSNCADVLCAHRDLCKAKTAINAALAAPARNCDVYDNESCRMAYHLHGDGIMTMQAFADWLFAPATEQKGATNVK